MNQKFPIDEAVACYCAGWSEGDIAKLFKEETSTVRKEIEEARAAGLIVPKKQTQGDGRRDNSLSAFLEREINETFHARDLHVTVVPSPHAMFRKYIINDKEGSCTFNKYSEAERQALLLASGYAAQYLREVLLDGREHVVGLNWGSAVRSVIEKIIPLLPRSHGKIEVVSLFGDLAFGSTTKEDSSWNPANTNCNSLVTNLTMRIGEPVEGIHLAVPGFIPTTFGDEEDVLKGIKDFLCGHSSYQRIFGGVVGKKTGVVERVDTILTGFGSADAFTLSHGRLGSWLKDDDKKKLKKYQNALAGDLGGHYEVAEKSGTVSQDCRNFADRLSDRVLAAQPEHFVSVAQTHRESRRGAGVVGVVVGARKALILRTLLCKEQVPINKLYTDSHCALALLNMLTDGNKEWREELAKQLPNYWESRDQWSGGTNELIGLASKS